MQNIRSRGTKPERLVFSALRKRGIYFAPYVTNLKGKPDIVFRRKRVVIFIDSDFWHAHKKHFVMPKSNTRYWKSKIRSNKKRDEIVNRELRSQGWKVIRIWESDIKKNLDKSISKILKAINSIN